MEIFTQNLPFAVPMPLIVVAAIWSLIWKGLALWRAARNEHKIWYVVLLVVNTLGLLEILYYFFFSKKKSSVPQSVA